MTIEPAGGAEPVFRLESVDSVYIMLPDDGQYGGVRYYGSGQEVASTLAAEFALHTNSVSTAVNSETLDAAVGHCLKNSVEYVLLPQIIHWEDRATNWSGRRDHISVKFTIYASKSKKIMQSSMVNANNSWFTFVNNGPGVLLKKPIKQYVSQLYR